MKFDTDEKIEKAVRWKGLEPVHKEQFEYGSIYIADGWVSKEEAEKWDLSSEYPNGLYQTMWIWKTDKPKFAHWVEFEPYHDFERLGMDNKKKRQARVNYTIDLAKEFVTKTCEPIHGGKRQ